jgi:hypothetical protein
MMNASSLQLAALQDQVLKHVLIICPCLFFYFHFEQHNAATEANAATSARMSV